MKLFLSVCRGVRMSTPHHADGRHTCIKTEEVQKYLYLGVASAEFDAIKNGVSASNKFVVISLS